MANTDGFKPIPIRRRTGTADWHLLAAAVTTGSEDIEGLTEARAVRLVAQARWGSMKTVVCAHCKTIDEHYWRKAELRWKCRACGKTFSVTSGTVFADHKLELRKLLKIIFAWSNGASGKPALQLRRDWQTGYLTTYIVGQKLREAIMRGYNTGVLCGVAEIDGLDINGRRYRELRGKPQGAGAVGKPKVPAKYLAAPAPAPAPSEAEFVGPPEPPKFQKKQRTPVDRRIALVIRQRGRAAKKGGAATRVGIALAESRDTVTRFATRYATAESVILSDEDPAYARFKALFKDHRTVVHSKTFRAEDGTNNNLAESFNWRMRRSAEGIYLNISNKYLADYLSENAWREDLRRTSNRERFHHLLTVATFVGPSIWHRGYWQGKHREYEMLIEGQKPAKGRGRAARDAWKPSAPR